MIQQMDFLLWVRGTGFEIALAVFVFGVLLRLLEIFLIGTPLNYSEARASGVESGFRMMFRRNLPEKNMLPNPFYLFTLAAGYLFHLGFFIVLFFFAPHIEIFTHLFGLSWPNLPTPITDFAAVTAMLALLAILFHRLTSPLLRFLSTPADYIVWLLAFLPLLTGYLTYHHLCLPYQLMLGLHILSVEILLIVFPFSKFMHAFTLFTSRWYNGYIAGRKGVLS